MKITLLSSARKKLIFAMPVCVIRGSLGSDETEHPLKIKEGCLVRHEEIPALESHAVGPLRAVFTAIQSGPIEIISQDNQGRIAQATDPQEVVSEDFLHDSLAQIRFSRAQHSHLHQRDQHQSKKSTVDIAEA